MQDVEYDYIANAALFTPGGVRAYNVGDGVSADAVNAFGWQLGVDVIAARPDVIERPAGNARRADWEQYWLGQRLGQDEIDAMTRDEMAHRDPVAPGTQAAGEQTAQAAVSDPLTDAVAAQGNEHNVVEEPGSDARKPEWVAYAKYRGLDEKTAGESTIAQLQAFDYDQL